MMANGTRVLIYAGDCDFVCNWLGNQAWTLALQWSGQAGFNSAANVPWLVNGEAAGNIRSYDTLAFATVANAGHMAPGGKLISNGGLRRNVCLFCTCYCILL